jgi:hypothetical protein
VRPVTISDAILLGFVLVAVTLWRPDFWREIAATPNEPIGLLAD